MTFASTARLIGRLSVLSAFALLIGCAPIVKGYRQNLAQGQLLTQKQVNSIHSGMTRMQVEEHLGQPVLTSVYDPNKMVYIFTMLPVHGAAYKKQLLITLRHQKVIATSQMGY